MNATFLGLSASPIEAFVRSFFNGLANQAFAQSTGTDPRALIAIRAMGAPTRWGWDQILNPGGETLVYNPVVATHFSQSDGRYTTPVYGTTIYKGMTVPYTWSFDVPHSRGGTRPMTDLLNNMLVIRGVDVVDNGHPGAIKKQYMNPGNSVSLQGTLADNTQRSPLSTIVTRKPNQSSIDFQSRKNLQLIDTIVNYNYNSQNLISDVMTPFKVNNSKSVRTLAFQHDLDIQNTYSALTTVSSDLNQTLQQSIRNADEIIRNGLGDLNTEWAQLKSKYDNLISRALNQVYPGINDLPVGTLGLRDNTYRLDNGFDPTLTPDDLRQMISTSTDLGSTAAQFALTEYMITRGFTNSIVINLDVLTGLSHNKSNMTLKATSNHDQHFSGSVITTFLSSFIFSAFSACLLELIDQLKLKSRHDGRNLFNETVIQFGGEFNRTGQADGQGTDHAHDSSSFTHWCGSINGPIVVGNILDQPRSAYHRGSTVLPGTWGIGAKIPELGGQTALTGNILSSASTLLRVPTPSINNMSLVLESGASLIGPPTIIPWSQG